MSEHSLISNGPRVVCLIGTELVCLEYGIVYEVFGLPRPELGPDWYRFGNAAVEPGLIKASGGLRVLMEQGLESLDCADLIFIPGWAGASSAVTDNVIAAVRKAYCRGARIVSLCTGAAVLAATGLLDGGPATTHWRHRETLAVRYPSVDFDAEVLYIDRGRVLTSAGGSAGADLCIHIVRQDYGVERANLVAKELVMPAHRDGDQSQLLRQPVPRSSEARRLGRVMELIKQDIEHCHPLDALARVAGMSLRTFQRRFEALTGMSPGAWLLRERLRRACDLLQLPGGNRMQEVAVRSGFGTLAVMQYHFRKTLKTSPRGYRKVYCTRLR